MNSKELRSLIDEMKFGRDVHIDWKTFLKIEPEKAEIAGDQEWHTRWIILYNKVIKILEEKLKEIKNAE